MTITAALSITSATVGLLAALLALGMSTAPGWRELRWFAACCAFAGLFELSNSLVTVPVPIATQVFASRLSLFFGGMHGVAWYFYTAAQQHRRLDRLERAIVAVACVLSTLSLVPGAILRSDVLLARAVPSLGLVYRDAVPTALGRIALGFHAFGLGLLFVRYAHRAVRHERGAAAHAVVLAAVLAGATHDGMAQAGVVGGPYLLDFALFALVISIGGVLVSRFVASARALEVYSRELAQAHEELVKRERLAAVGELAAVVAHEVRNPLAVVYNALASLRKVAPGGPDHATLLAIAQEEADRLRDIVSHLLDFARPRAPTFVTVPLEAVVRSAIDAARRANGAAEADVVLDPLPPELAPLECDEQRVHQAVVNLVTNALLASGRRGPVRVAVDEVARPEPSVEIRVQDDGDGVPRELRERIFAPFFSTRPTGSGLGLAVVQRSAEAHGGEARVEDTPGGGATFVVRLPRRARRTPAAAT